MRRGREAGKEGRKREPLKLYRSSCSRNDERTQMVFMQRRWGGMGTKDRLGSGANRRQHKVQQPLQQIGGAQVGYSRGDAMNGREHGDDQAEF